MRERAAPVTALVGGAAYGAAVGALATASVRLAVPLTLFGVLLVLMAWRTVAIAVIAVPGVFIIQRAPLIDVSYVDIIVAVAGAAAFLAGAQRALTPNARVVLWAFAAYLGLLLGSVAFNQSLRSDFEWIRRISVVAGSMLVGAWLVREGLAHIALRALLMATVLLGILAVGSSASEGFAPASPLWYHKNYVGSISATVLLVLVAAPGAFRLSAMSVRVAAVFLTAGLLAAQSRGAILALSAGLLIWFVRIDRDRRRRFGALAVVALVGFTALVGLSIRAQLARRVVNPHDSISQRIEVESATRELWQAHPMTGVGLRYFSTPEFNGYQPPNNVVNEVLAEAGFPGLIGFVIFVGGSLIGLSRRRDQLALAALCVVSARFVHGLVDIYWVAGTTTLPWLIAGMGLASPRQDSNDDPPLPSQVTRPDREARSACQEP